MAVVVVIDSYLAHFVVVPSGVHYEQDAKCAKKPGSS